MPKMPRMKTSQPVDQVNAAQRPRLPIAALGIACAALLIVGFSWKTRPQRWDAIERSSLGYRIDVNQADAETLCLLPGIGPGIAGNIIEHREAAGRIGSPAELEDVHRIGPKTRTRMQAWVRFE